MWIHNQKIQYGVAHIFLRKLRQGTPDGLKDNFQTSCNVSHLENLIKLGNILTQKRKNSLKISAMEEF